MAHYERKIGVASNPHRRATSSRPPARKKGSNMAKAAAKKKRPNGGKKSRRKSNPTSHRRSKKRNPAGLGSIVGSTRSLATASVAGLGSAIATRQLPQVVLGDRNTGWQGYLANGVTAGLATWLAAAIAGPDAGRGAAIGGGVIILDRILSEQVSPIAGYLSLSGVGDAMAYNKIGTVRQGYYTHPNLQNPDGSMYVPDPITDAAMAAVAAKYGGMMPAAPGGRVGAVNPSSLRRHTANGMLLSSRFAGRFNQ